MNTENAPTATPLEPLVGRPLVRSCWIKPDGEELPCPNWNDHLHIASVFFGDSKQGPEGDAVDAGWIKVFRLDDGVEYVGGEFTSAQRDTLHRLRVNVDEAQDTAIANRNYWRRNSRCSA